MTYSRNGYIMGIAWREANATSARRERPSGYTAADQCDEVPPPHGAYPKAKDHGAYPKAKDHELIIAPCVAARSGHFCPLWVNSRQSVIKQPCPLYPRKRTLSDTTGMSA